MASKNEKICHLLSFLVMLVYFRIVTSTNIDCGGKPFHCVNSTHFMICVDVGSEVSQTVDDFTIQCPATTVCRGSNYFECEYEVITTKEPTIRGDQEHIKETINGKTTVSPFQKNNATRLNEYVNTISVTAQPNITTDAYTQQPSAITEIKGISTTKNDIASTSELILSTTETYVAENLITTSPKTKSNDTSATLEKIKISKNNLLDKVTTLPSFLKPEKSIEVNTTRNFTNETNNLQNIAENGEESLQKNETSYSQPPDTLLHNETTVQIGNDLSTLTSQDTPASYRNYLPVLTTLSDLVTLTATNHFNKENITFNKTLSQDGQDSSRNVTTKLLLQNLTTVNTILSQNVNQTPTSNYDYSYSRMKDQTSTTALNLIHQRTENPFSSAYATENSVLSTQDNHILKEATSPNILTTNVNTLSTTVAPITNVPLSTDFKLRTKPVEDSTVTTESTTTDKNTNLTQYDVKTNKPLKSEVKPILQSITTMHATKNTTIATTVVPSTTVKVTTTHLLQNQTATEASLLEDFQLSNIVNEKQILANNSLTQAPETTTIRSAINYETKNNLIMEITREPISSYKDTKSSSDTGFYISTNSEKTIFNENKKGLHPFESESTTEKISTTINISEFNMTKNRSLERTSSKSNMMLLLENVRSLNSPDKLPSTENPITKINTPVELYSATKNSPYDHTTSVEIKKKITTEKPIFSSNAHVNDSFSLKRQTTLETSLPTEVYELLTGENGLNKTNKSVLLHENYIVEPTQLTKILQINQFSENKVVKEITTRTTLYTATSNTTIADTKHVSHDQKTKENYLTESLTSTTKSSANGNYTEDPFISKNSIIESTTSSSIHINKVHMQKGNKSTNNEITTEINGTLPIQDVITVKDFYLSSTKMSNTLSSVSDNNNIANVTNIFTIIPEKSTTASNINEKETLMSQNLTSVNIDKSSAIFISGNKSTKLDAINKNNTRGDLIISLNGAVKNQYIETKSPISQQQQTYLPSNSFINTKTMHREKADVKILFPNAQILGDKNTHESTITPVTDHVEIQPKLTNLNSGNNKSDIAHVAIDPDSNLVIERFPTIQTPNNTLLPKIEKENKNTTKSVNEIKYSLKHEKLADGKQIMEVALKNSEAKSSNTNIHKEKSNLTYVNKDISNDRVNIEVDSLKPTSTDTNLISAGNITTTLYSELNHNVTESTLLPTDNSIKNQINVLIRDDNAQHPKSLNSSNPADEIKVSASKNITNMNLPAVSGSTQKIIEIETNNNFEHKVNLVISPAQPALETLPHSVFSTSTQVSMDKIKVTASNDITNLNMHKTSGNTEKVTENASYLENKVDAVFSDTVNTQPSLETLPYSVLSSSTVSSLSKRVNIQPTQGNIAYSVLSSSTPVSTNEINFPSSNMSTTISSDTANIQSTRESTEHSVLSSSTFASTDEVQLKTINITTISSDAVNIQPTRETKTNSVLSSSTPASTDKINVSANYKMVIMSPPTVAGSTEEVLEKNNNLKNKVHMVISDTMITQPNLDSLPLSVLSSSTPTSTDKIKLLTNRTTTTIKSNTVDIQTIWETKANSASTSSIPDITNEVNKISTINSQTVTGSKGKISENNNMNKVNVLISDIVNTQPVKETTPFSVLSPSTLTSTDNIKISTSNQITTSISLSTVAGRTEKIFENNNNLENKTVIVISDTLNTQSTLETLPPSMFSSSTPSYTDNDKVLASNNITNINLSMVSGSTETIIENNNNFENKIDVAFSDTVNAQSASETLPQSILSSSTPASTKIEVLTSNIIATITSDLHTPPTQETIARSVLNSSTPVLTDEIKFPISNISTTITRDTVDIEPIRKSIEHSVLSSSTPSTMEIKVPTYNIITTVTSNKVNIQPTRGTIENFGSSSFTPASTEKINVSASNKITTMSPPTIIANTEKVFQNNNNFENKEHVVISDTVKIQATLETLPHTVISSSTSAPAIKINISANNKITTKSPPTVGSTEKVFGNTTKPTRENTTHLVLRSSMPNSIDKPAVNHEVTTIRPLTGSTKNIFENDKISKDTVDVISILNSQPIQNFLSHSGLSSSTRSSPSIKVNIQPPQETIAYSILSSSTPAPRDVIKFATSNSSKTSDKVNIQPVREHLVSSSSTPALMDEINGPTRHIITTIPSDTVHIDPTRDTIVQFASSSPSPTPVDKVKVSASNKISSMNLQTVVSSTEKIIESRNNNFENKVDVVINDTVNNQPAMETSIHSVLSLLKSASTDKDNVSASDNITNMNVEMVIGSTEKIFKKNNNYEKKIEMIISDTMKQLPTLETYAQSILSSSTPDLKDKINSMRSNIISTSDTLNVQPSRETVARSTAHAIATESTPKIYHIENNAKNKVDINYDLMNTQLHQKPAGQYISESLTPVLMDESKVSTNNRNPQMATGSTGNIFLYSNQNFENSANVMISDTRKTHLDMMTVSQNTLGASLPATIDNMKLSVDNTFPTSNSQIPNKDIGNKLQYKNNKFENKGDMIHTDTVNTQPAKETTTNHELTLLKPASTDEFKVSEYNMVTAINPHTETGSTEKINESNNVKFGHKVDLVNSFTEYVRSDKVTTQSVLGSLSPALTDKITVSASDKITSKYLETTSESIGKVIDNSNLNNFENKVGIVIHDMVNTQPAQKTIVHSVLSSSTSAPRDEIQLSASSKIATINPQMLTGSTKEIVVNNNNFENKAHVVIIDTVNTQPAQKTIAYSAFNSPTPASTAEIKVSTGNQFNAINPPGKTLHNSSSNNIANEVGVSINNKVNAQFATKETIAHLVGSPSTSMDKIKVSASNIVTTTTTKPVTKSVGNTLQHNNNNFQIKIDMVTSDMGNTHFAKETVAQALLSSTTRVSVDTLKFSSNNKITTNPHTVISSTERLLENNNINNNLELKTGVISEIANSQPAQNTKASNQIASLIPQITIGRTGKVFQNSNNNFETKVDVISDAVNKFKSKFVKETVARSVFVSSTPASADEIKVSASNNIATITQQTLTESTGNIFQYSNIKFKNKVDIISSDAVNTQLSKATVAHPVLDSSTRDEIKVLDSYTLTTTNPHFATRSMGKMVLTNDNLVNEQKVHTTVHESPGSHPTSLRFEGTKNNESINVLQNEPVTVSINNRASQFSAHNLSVKVSIDAMPNNVSKDELNKSPYENTTTKETILTLPTVQVRNKLNNPILLKINETSKKHNSDINKVQNRNAANMTIQPIYSNNKRHEQVLKQTTLPQLKVAGKQLQNKLHNNTAVTKDYRTIAMKDIFTCQNRLRGRYADANDCRKFYICIGRIQPLLGECPVNTVFSEIKKQCTKNLSHCIRHNQFRCIKSGRFSDALKNNVYYICVQNKNTYVRFQFQCQGGYHLNKQRVKCVSDIKSQQMSKSIDNDSNKASAQSTVENKSKEKKRSKERKAKADKNVCKEEGKFPDPDDCRKYYVCSKNSKSVFRRRTKKCDSDEVFHPEKEKCVDSDSYECD